MSDNTLLLIGAVILAIIYGVLTYANATGRKLEKSVPLEFALKIAEYLANSTPTKTDDELIAKIEDMLYPLLPDSEPAPMDQHPEQPEPQSK
ncbi:MAG: hypothetical protein EBR82_30605 [Caulobacteraceae bacterium]|nr:hypothetical protein [Caulobacteraceae bacterium]